MASFAVVVAVALLAGVPAVPLGLPPLRGAALTRDRSSLNITHEGKGDQGYLCSQQSGGSCMMSNCDSARGKVVCQSGSCVCEPGLCADGHGRCLSKTRARELPGTYKIEIRDSPGNYLYMKKFGSTVTYQKGDPGPQGHWHVVVNNDDTVMLYTAEWKDAYFMSIEDVSGAGESADYKASYATFSSPWRCSFAIHGDAEGNAYLKDIRTKRWVEARYWSVKGVRNFGSGGALKFDPPLQGVRMMQGAAQRVRSLLPLALLLGALLA